MSSELPPPADTPPFPDEADFEMAIAACLHVARHAKEDGFQAFHGRLEQAGDRLRIHLATLAAAHGTARQLEEYQKQLHEHRSPDGDGRSSEPDTQKPGQGSGHYWDQQDYELPARPTQSAEIRAGSEPADALLVQERAACAALREAVQAIALKWREIGSRPNRPTGFLICADELEEILRAALQWTP